MLMPVTLTIAVACAALSLWLAARISLRRFGTGAMIGDGGDARLFSLQRAHANFAEYAPLVLLLIAAIEAAGGARRWLWIAGGAFVLGRIAHGFGMPRAAPNPLRAGGILATWLVLAVLAIWAGTIAYGAVVPHAVEVVPAELPRG